jgi:hypothetical protein
LLCQRQVRPSTYPQSQYFFFARDEFLLSQQPSEQKSMITGFRSPSLHNRFPSH